MKLLTVSLGTTGAVLGVVACGALAAACSGTAPTGLVDPPPDSIDTTPLPPPSAIEHVSPAERHTCALATDGRAFCWGQNAFGELGDGTEDPSTVPVAVEAETSFVQIAAGGVHTCGLTASMEVWCWGLRPQIGDGAGSGARNATRPVRTVGLPPIVTVAAGWLHTCALDEEGLAWCWGSIGRDMHEPTAVPIQVRDSTRFTDLAAGMRHTCGILLDGGTLCWGQNLFAQLGSLNLGDSVAYVPAGDSVVSVAAGTFHSCDLRSSGEAYCWGRPDHGQLGNGVQSFDEYAPTPVHGDLAFTSISVGASRSCGLTAGGKAYCWGGNYAGGLGDGSTQASSVPVAVAGNLAFRLLRVGDAATCGISESSQLYCWGPNLVGQLGDGTLTSRSVPTLVTFR